MLHGTSSLSGLYGYNNWTSLLDGLVADGLEEKDGTTLDDNELNEVKDAVNSFFSNIFNKEGVLLTLEEPLLVEDGLWINFSYNDENLEEVFNEVFYKANKLGIIEEIENYLMARSMVNVKGFDLSKITSSHDNLIIGLSGAGVYPRILQNNDQVLKTYTEKPEEEIPTYGCATYPLPVDYVSNNTIAVIGTPWLSSVSESIEQPAENWDPDPEEFASKIQEALDKMSPNKKLILLGKSLGGCQMQEIAHELDQIDVDVDLLIIVDGSCSPGDHSSEFKTIYPNVKRVYNFRQTMDYPENDGQNGFQLEWAIPTIGEDRVVNDEDLESPMCSNVGHNDMDECPELLSEIDLIIRGLIRPPLSKLNISMRNEGTYEDNIVKQRVKIENSGSEPISDIKIYDYFTADANKQPVLDDFYTPRSKVSLKNVGKNNHVIVYDFEGKTFNPDEVVPNGDGNVIGIHYLNWEPLNKNQFLSYSDDIFSDNNTMDIKLADGRYVFGNVSKESDNDFEDETGESLKDTMSISSNQTVVVPPEGITIEVDNPDYMHGLMFTVRNEGINDYINVEWHGVLDQNDCYCLDRLATLNGNGAQINNVCTPKKQNGKMYFDLSSQDSNNYKASVEIFDWRNGGGCN